jgi:cephalosporin-C deacetylase
MKRLNFIFCLIISVSIFASPIPVEKPVKIIITPNHADWNYALGEKVNFKIEVQKNGLNIPNLEISCQYGPETQKPFKEEKIFLKDGSTSLDAGTMVNPGFLRIHVKTVYEKDAIEGICTLAFSPLMIKHTVEMPSDFLTFWNNAIKKNKQIPLNPMFEIQPNQCTEKVNVYHVSFHSYRSNSRIYGWLAVPKKAGKYPAVIQYPGAGVWKKQADTYTAARGFITLNIFIHGIPLTMPDSIYDILKNSALNQYYLYGIDDVDRYYYERVIIGCISAVDFVSQLPEYDGQNLAVTGQSQGGALSIITASLDKRVKTLAVFHPALCDLTGYLYGRAGGWPGVFKYYTSMTQDDIAAKKTVTSYYDVVNFAKYITQPIYFSGGYNDEVCAPTSYYSAYNRITSPKSITIYKETGHWVLPEQQSIAQEWLLNLLK